MSRSKFDMFAEVLETTRGGTTKTRIVTEVNLNQEIATHMLNLLVDLNLLAARHNSPISYDTTEKGFRFLDEYRRLKRLLDSRSGLQEKL